MCEEKTRSTTEKNKELIKLRKIKTKNEQEHRIEKNRASCHLAHRSKQMEFGLGGCSPAAYKPAEANPTNLRHLGMEGIKNDDDWIASHLSDKRFPHQEVSVKDDVLIR